jgi:hypothetical protein
MVRSARIALPDTLQTLRHSLIDPATKQRVLQELRHAQEQIDLQAEYPGRQRSLPSDVKPIDTDPDAVGYHER